MALIDFVTDRRNRITVASAAAVGLAIVGAVGVSLRTPAYEVRDSNGQTNWSVDLGGQSTQSGTITSKSLLSCDTIDTTSTGMLICGSDATGAGGGSEWSGTGALQDFFDNRFVNTSGDSMTGSLTVSATISGTIVRANDALTSSGYLAVENGIYGASLAQCTSTQKLEWANGVFSCVTDTDTTYGAAQGLTLTSGFFLLNSALTGSSLNFTTISGAIVRGYELLSSGALVIEGTSSFGEIATFSGGNGRVVSTSGVGGIQIVEEGGNGGKLTFGNNTAAIGISSDGTIGGYDYDGTFVIRQSGSNPDGNAEFIFLEEAGDWRFALPKSLAGYATYNPRSFMVAGPTTNSEADLTCANWGFGRLDCNTSATGPDLAVKDDAQILGSLYVGETASGTDIHATTGLTSSGNLVWEGTASGSQIRGLGLTDCDTGSTSKLLWDTTNGVFSCGTDTDTNTTYNAAQGLTLANGFFNLNAALTGTSLSIYGTSSGRIFNAMDELRSSGSLVVEGAATFGSTVSLNNVTYTFPSGDGAANTVLTTNAAGTLTWSNVFRVAGQGLTADTQAVRLSDSFSGTSLEIMGVSSGRILHAQDTLESSGTLVVNGTATIHGTLSGNLITGTFSPRITAWEVASGATLVGSGKVFIPIPRVMSGWLLTGVETSVGTAGTTNATKVQITKPRDGYRRMLSTPVQIDSTHYSSIKSATPVVIDASNRNVIGGEMLSVDIAGISTTAARDLYIVLTLSSP